MNDMIFGFFESSKQVVPAFDPGLEVLCPLCERKLERPVVTISFMRPGIGHSYFYRLHKQCSDAADPAKITAIESAVIDAPEMIARPMFNN